MRQLDALLRAEGIHAALARVNARVRFRFTGIFQVDPPLLRNVHLFDRENPAVNVSGAVARLDVGYCAITCGSGAPFTTTDARRDPRLQGHPAQHAMISYAGVPLRPFGDAAWGTLCHFDARPRLLSRAELPMLEAIAPLFAAWVRERCAPQ